MTRKESPPLFYARFDRNGLSIEVHELEDNEWLVSRIGREPLPNGHKSDTFGTRKEAITEALGFIDDYT